MPTWEYASIVTQLTRREVTKDSAEAKRLPPAEQRRWETQGWTTYNWYESRLHLWRPGAAAAEERLMWDSADPGTSNVLLIVLNELGAEGWELVSDTVRGNAVYPLLGHPTAGQSVLSTYWLKRPRQP